MSAKTIVTPDPAIIIGRPFNTDVAGYSNTGNMFLFNRDTSLSELINNTLDTPKSLQSLYGLQPDEVRSDVSQLVGGLNPLQLLRNTAMLLPATYEKTISPLDQLANALVTATARKSYVDTPRYKTADRDVILQPITRLRLVQGWSAYRESLHTWLLTMQKDLNVYTVGVDPSLGFALVVTSGVGLNKTAASSMSDTYMFHSSDAFIGCWLIWNLKVLNAPSQGS